MGGSTAVRVVRQKNHNLPVPQRTCIAGIHYASQFPKMKDQTIVPVMQLPACLNSIQKTKGIYISVLQISRISGIFAPGLVVCGGTTSRTASN